MSKVLPLFQGTNATESSQIIARPLDRPPRHPDTPRPTVMSALEDRDIPADIAYELRDSVLRIKVSGPLDLRCTSRLLAIARAVDDSVSACHLILSEVTQVYDSGLAALILLTKHLAEHGIGWVCIEDLDHALAIGAIPPRTAWGGPL